MKRLLVVVPVLALSGGLASAAPALKKGGILRVGMSGPSVSIDPQLASIGTAWWLEYATAAKLYNYPDKSGQAGGVLRPEVASRYAVSRDGKTYTINIRNGFRFSDGSPVTARNFAYAIDRVANHGLASPGGSFITDPNGTNIVGAKAVFEGRATHVSGVTVTGNKLIIRLMRSDASLLTKLAMPFFQATSTKLPLTREITTGYPSAGPYYFSRNDVNRVTSLRQNPHWRPGRDRYRPRNLSGVDIRWNGTDDWSEDDLDLGPIQADRIEELADRFGVNKTRFWSMPTSCVAYMRFNSSRGLFANNPRMRRAINWALDRRAYADMTGAYAGSPWTHILSPVTPGSVTAKRRQPYTPGPNVAKARKLAAGHFKDGRIVVLVGLSGSGPRQAELIRRDLIRLGFEPDNIVLKASGFDQPRGTEWDLDALPIGWCADFADPYSLLKVFLVDLPRKYANKLAAAAKGRGAAHLRALGELDLEVMREAAPLAPVRTYNKHYLFSNRVDPRSLVYQPAIEDWSIPALALK